MTAILLSAAALWAIAVMTPGPNFLLVSHAALNGSRASALWTVLGIAAGTVVWGCAGFLGVGFLFVAAPWLYLILKIAGGLYLVWLGGRILRSALRPPVAVVPVSGAEGTRRAFTRGLVTAVSNPKSGAFVTSMFAATLPPDPTPALGAAIVGTMVVLTLSWYGTVTWTLGHERPRRLYGRSRRVIEGLAGGIFILFGLRLASGR